MLGLKRRSAEPAPAVTAARPALRVVNTEVDTAPAEPWRQLGCARDPWAPAPDPALFFATPVAQKLHMSLLTALRIGDSGLYLVTGEAGVGKTMLLKVLENALRAAGETVVLHACDADGADWQQHLDGIGSGTILLIDGAELSDGKAIGRLEQLFGQPDGAVRNARLVLCGRPEVEQRLQRLVGTALGSKVTFARLRLDRLEPATVGDYVLHRLKAAGFTGAQPLSAEALQRLAERSEGIPRRINELAVHALAAVAPPPAATTTPASARQTGGRGRTLGFLAAAIVVALAAVLVPNWLSREAVPPSLTVAAIAPEPVTPPPPPPAAAMPAAAPAAPAPVIAAVPPPPPAPVAKPETPPVVAKVEPPPPAPPAAAAEEERAAAAALSAIAPAAGPPPVVPAPPLPPVAAALPAAPARAVLPPPMVPPRPAPSITAAQGEALLGRGDELLRTGDIAAARLLYERAASGGYGPAMRALARTYDPAVLKMWGTIGIAADPEKAQAWYRKAAEAGE